MRLIKHARSKARGCRAVLAVFASRHLSLCLSTALVIIPTRSHPEPTVSRAMMMRRVAGVRLMKYARAEARGSRAASTVLAIRHLSPCLSTALAIPPTHSKSETTTISRARMTCRVAGVSMIKHAHASARGRSAALTMFASRHQHQRKGCLLTSSALAILPTQPQSDPIILRARMLHGVAGVRMINNAHANTRF